MVLSSCLVCLLVSSVEIGKFCWYQAFIKEIGNIGDQAFCRVRVGGRESLHVCYV